MLFVLSAHFLAREEAGVMKNICPKSTIPHPPNKVHYPQRSVPKTLYAIRRRRQRVTSDKTNPVLSMVQKVITALKSI